jgi:hypothetical protein
MWVMGHFSDTRHCSRTVESTIPCHSIALKEGSKQQVCWQSMVLAFYMAYNINKNNDKGNKTDCRTP